MAHLLQALKIRKCYFRPIRPVAMGLCWKAEYLQWWRTEMFSLWRLKSFLCETKFRSIQHRSIVTCGWNFTPVYIIHELNLVSYGVDGESWNHEKIIWVQVWFPKRDSDNSYRMFNWTWVSLYNSPGLSQGKCLPSYLATTFMKQKRKRDHKCLWKSLAGDYR